MGWNWSCTGRRPMAREASERARHPAGSRCGSCARRCAAPARRGQCASGAAPPAHPTLQARRRPGGGTAGGPPAQDQKSNHDGLAPTPPLRICTESPLGAVGARERRTGDTTVAPATGSPWPPGRMAHQVSFPSSSSRPTSAPGPPRPAGAVGTSSSRRRVSWSAPARTRSPCASAACSLTAPRSPRLAGRCVPSTRAPACAASLPASRDARRAVRSAR